MSGDDPYSEYPNVIDLKAWKEQREIEDAEDLTESLTYFRELLEELIDEIKPDYRTFHAKSDDSRRLSSFMSGSGLPWELELEEMEWKKYDGDIYDDKEDDEF